MSLGDKISDGVIPVDDPEIQDAGRTAVAQHNSKTQENLIFIRVLNGLIKQVDNNTDTPSLVLVVETKNGGGIPWTYLAQLAVIVLLPPQSSFYILKSFEDVLKPYNN